ncbi:MAG: hypothetical protein KGZ69_12010 [Methylomonas sp.]|nr:hypothetical protein [Methylomonas sp.]
MKTRHAFVEWVDITVQSGWTKKTDKLAPSPVVSSGWVIEKTKTYIVLAADITPECHPGEHDEDAYNRRIAIPLGCVSKIRYLKP